MKKLFSKIKETKAILDMISKDKIAKRASIKSILFATILMLMIILPFVLVLVELFKQFSLIIPFTYFLLFLVFVLSMLFPMLYMTLYFELLKSHSLTPFSRSFCILLLYTRSSSPMFVAS